MSACAEESGWSDEDALFREVLMAFGMQRLREPTRQFLESVLPLARAQ